MIKFICLFVFIAFFMSSFVQGQGGLMSGTLPTNVQKTVIRETTALHSISYIETPTDHYFAYYDGSSNSAKEIRINTGFSINDFVIDNDSVFFCGSNVANQACVGHFDIQDFFNGTQSYFSTSFPFYYIDNGMLQTISSFEQMITYEESGHRRLATTGYISSIGSVVTEIYYDLTTSIKYKIGQLSINSERIRDISLTDNYVLTAGFTNSSPSLPIIRVYERSSMFKTGGPQDTITYFRKYGPQTVLFDPEQLLLSHLQGDTFAMAAYWRNNNSNVDTGTFVSMQRVESTHHITWLNSMVTTQFRQSGGWQLRGMTGMDNTAHFYLLQTAELPNYTNYTDLLFTLTPSMFNLAPYGSTMTMARTAEPTVLSIDALSNHAGFVSNGYRINYPLQLVYYLTSSYTQNCLASATQPIYPIDMTLREQLKGFNVYSGTGNNFSINTGTIHIVNMNIECTE